MMKTNATRRPLRQLGGLLCLAAALTISSSATAADQPTPATNVDEDSFTIKVTNARASVGEAATIKVTVEAANGYHANDAYPNKIKDITATAGAKVSKDTVPGRVDGTSVSYSVEVTPTKAGKAKVSGEIRFSVCNADSCQMKKIALDATVTGV